MGILFAFIALFCWGFGDFLIQKSTRQLGNWQTLFFDNSWIVIVLLPFIYHDLPVLFSSSNAVFLLLAGFITLAASLFDFEALKRGKIAIVEPIYALEILVTVFISAALINERLSFWQLVVIFFLVFGIIMLSIESFFKLKKIKLEQGIWCAFFASVSMGIVNFIFGIGARQVSPLAINWIISLFLLIVAASYFMATGQTRKIVSSLKKKPALIFGFSILNNAAWISYAYSTLYIPMGIAVGISESYVALAAALGIFFNREKLNRRQIIGMIIAIVSVIILAVIS